MHGRPRQLKGTSEDPEKVKASQKRIALYSRLSHEVLNRRAAKQYDEESLKLAGKLLEHNPELYTIWNYRREALSSKLQGSDGHEAAQKVAQQELQLTNSALSRNPKSYSSWHHRKWIVQMRLVPLDAELHLVKQFMMADSRNFHCWSYWRLLVDLMGLSAEDQEAYVLGRIEDNFSNYSAWHERTRVLQHLNMERPTLSLAELLAADSKHCCSSESSSGFTGTAEVQPLPSHVLQQEYELVKNAFYTEPHDQSSWLYLRWLVGNSLAGWEKCKGTEQQPSATQTLKGMLEDQASMCQDILQMEEQVNSGIEDRSGQKWPLLTLARLKEVQHHLSHPADSTCPEAQKIYRTLIEIDPFRKGYYHDAMHGKATMVIRSLNSAISTPS